MSSASVTELAPRRLPARLLLLTEGACLRCWSMLDHAVVLRFFSILLPFMTGLLALGLGQDDNWDLHNYHHYNPFAYLNGKIGFDLAPAQWQSYFNPTIDLLYYGLLRAMPAPLAGFVMGMLHGLNLVIVLRIAVLLVGGAGAPRWRLPLLLALAGAFAPGYLSQVGNTMGDNLTAMFVLGALALVLRQAKAVEHGAGVALAPVLLAGLLVGLGTGLKLTNATYALALCLALLILPLGWYGRLRHAFMFGIATLAGIAISAGHWYWKMWSVFGNPLFPQFNNIFKAPLAAAIGIGDTGWIPKGLWEKLAWPFIFTKSPSRVIEIPMTQLIWPLLYVAMLALGLRLLRRAVLGQGTQLAPVTKLFLVFFALAYLFWLNLFGIYRYLVPLELLAPLALWLALHATMQAAFARWVSAWAIVLATAAIFPLASWGHASWEREAFRIQSPAFATPEQSMVFTVHGDPPMGWLVPGFPVRLAFVALGSGFPESRQFAARVARMMAERNGPLYVMMQVDRRDPAQVSNPEELAQIHAFNGKVHERGQEILDRYGIRLRTETCRVYPAYVGSSYYPYQLCQVAKPDPKRLAADMQAH